MNWRNFLLLLFFFSFPGSLFAQVLTLNRSECVQVETSFSEMVPYHKYRFFLDEAIRFEEHDIVGLDQEDYKPDTTALKIEDEITVFLSGDRKAWCALWLERKRTRLIYPMQIPTFLYR
jgi:hypothetical protein